MSKLVIVRHGQSIWNLQNRFTGWVDVSLSKKGLVEARRAAIKLKNFKFDVAFTSNLLRAQETLFEILNRNLYCNQYIRIHGNESKWYSHYKHTKSDDLDLVVFSNEALNERFYGDLQGLNKDGTRKKFGEKLVQLWRRSYSVRPPGGNALEQTSERTIPYFKKYIQKRLKKGENVIISAHGNSLRAIVKYIEKLDKKEIMKLEIGTGVPIVYSFDKDMNVKKKEILG